jgi:hypothetical protein
MLAEAAIGEKLPPPTRAAVLMALLGIALLGMLIVVIVLLGGHWVRRQGSFRRGPVVPPDRRPLSVPPEPAPSGDAQTEDADSTAGDFGDTMVPNDTQPGTKKSP